MRDRRVRLADLARAVGLGPNCQRLVPHRRGWSPWHWPLCRQGCTSRSYAYISKELGPAGILVNVVMPGATLTKRNVAVLPAAIREQMEKASPISRLLPPLLLRADEVTQ
jgi:hypothetical protein